MTALEDLHALVGGEGAPVAGELVAVPGARPMPAVDRLAGPRTAGREAQYALVAEAIYEGFELHHRAGRLFDAPDEDLAVLLGDHMYALGIERLVELADVPAVAELADTIAIASLAAAREDEALLASAWGAGMAAVAEGENAEHRAAKQLAREGGPAALDAMRTSWLRDATSR